MKHLPILLVISALTAGCSFSRLDLDTLYAEHMDPFQTVCEYHQTDEDEGFLCSDLTLVVRSWDGSKSHDDVVQAANDAYTDGIVIQEVKTETRDEIELDGKTYPISVVSQWSSFASDQPNIVGAAIHVSRKHNGNRDLYTCDMPIIPMAGLEQTYAEWGLWCRDAIAAMISATP